MLIVISYLSDKKIYNILFQNEITVNIIYPVHFRRPIGNHAV